jgi:hypothetical protein
MTEVDSNIVIFGAEAINDSDRAETALSTVETGR